MKELAWHNPFTKPTEPLAAQQWGYTDYLQVINAHSYQKFNMDNKLKYWKMKGPMVQKQFSSILQNKWKCKKYYHGK